MKTTALFLVLTSIGALAQASSYVNFIRQSQQGTGVVWDMPVGATGQAASALLMESGGSLFQLWTIHQAKATDYLLDQKLIGAYLPRSRTSPATWTSRRTASPKLNFPHRP